MASQHITEVLQSFGHNNCCEVLLIVLSVAKLLIKSNHCKPLETILHKVHSEHKVLADSYHNYHFMCLHKCTCSANYGKYFNWVFGYGAGPVEV